MGITRDGSVLRIALDSDASDIETRISFAVNCHQEMKRPRIEFSEKGFAGLFREMLPHLNADKLAGRHLSLSIDAQEKLVEELARIVYELAKMSLRGRVSGCASSRIFRLFVDAVRNEPKP